MARNEADARFKLMMRHNKRVWDVPEKARDDGFFFRVSGGIKSRLSLTVNDARALRRK
jgi:hypothetical protein